MTVKQDGSGNDYIEIVMPNKETVRVSKIVKGWTGSECYRINLVDTNNHVRQGAEFPKDNLQAVITALNKLAYPTDAAQKKRTSLDVLKTKIVSTLYDMPNHTLVSKKPDMKVIFSLDNYEMELLKEASDELEQEGYLEGEQNYSRLTPGGVAYARTL